MNSTFVIGFFILHEAITYLRTRHQIAYREHIVNLSIYAVSALLTRFVFYGLWYQLLNFAYQHRIADLPISLSVYIASLVLTDFAFYLSHLVQHRVPALWRIHLVHHSSNDFSLSTGMRMPWLMLLFIWVFYIPISLLGVPPIFVLFNRNLILFYQFFLHRPVSKKDSALGLIFCTASTHQVHHIDAPHYYNSNFGGIFSFWDRLFSTYKDFDSKIKVRYGVSGVARYTNPISVNFGPFIDFLRSAKPQLIDVSTDVETASESASESASETASEVAVMPHSKSREAIH